jgi:hypothetical protein
MERKKKIKKVKEGKKVRAADTKKFPHTKSVQGGEYERGRNREHILRIFCGLFQFISKTL